MCCGHLKGKVDILKQDIEESYVHDSLHYSMYRVFEKYECILCTLCQLEFSNQSPKFFGFGEKKQFGFDDIQFLKSIEKPVVGKDKCCHECSMRLSYIRFSLEVREANGLKNTDDIVFRGDELRGG